jgi:hypothetical protein
MAATPAPKPFGFAFSLDTAVVTKTLPFAAIGDDQPLPGISADHASDPPSGPRNCDQSPASARPAELIARHAKIPSLVVRS